MTIRKRYWILISIKSRDSDGNRWSLVKIKQFIVLIMRTYVIGIAQHETSDPD